MNWACLALGILVGLVALVAGMFVVWAIFGDH